MSYATVTERDGALRRLKHLCFAEGCSYLLLLLVAMPLKYAADLPKAVSIVGMIHGILFVLLVPVLLQTAHLRGWNLARTGLVFLWTMVPFGMIPLDKMLKRELTTGSGS